MGPYGFESTSPVRPRSLRVARFIGGRSIVASIFGRDMGEQRLPKSNKCHARVAQCSSGSLKKCDAVGFLRVSGVTFPVLSTPHISDTTPSCFSFRGTRFQPETWKWILNVQRLSKRFGDISEVPVVESFQTKASKRMETKQIIVRSHIRRLLFATALLLSGPDAVAGSSCWLCVPWATMEGAPRATHLSCFSLSRCGSVRVLQAGFWPDSLLLKRSRQALISTSF